MRDTEGESAVGARPHPQPDIGLVGETGAARVDHNQPRTSFERRIGGGRMGQPGKIWVVAPEEDAAGILKVRHINAGDTVAEGIQRGQITPPPA